MNITEEIIQRFKATLAEIPQAVKERLHFLSEHRVGSNFDKHGAVKHVVSLGRRVEKSAISLLQATFNNPYLTDQEKLTCLTEDSPEQYVMEACVELAEAFEMKVERKSELRTQNKENKKYRGDAKKIARTQLFSLFLIKTLDGITPTIVYNAIMVAKQQRVLLKNQAATSFIENMTVSFLKEKVTELVRVAEINNDIHILTINPKCILEKVIGNIINEFKSNTVSTGGIGEPVLKQRKAFFYSPRHGHGA